MMRRIYVSILYFLKDFYHSTRLPETSATRTQNFREEKKKSQTLCCTLGVLLKHCSHEFASLTAKCSIFSGLDVLGFEHD